MKYVLAIYGDPVNSKSGHTALLFAKTLLHKGHSIEKIFFYQDGVQQVNEYLIFPQDELNLPKEWVSLIHSFQVNADVCIGAGIRRGVINKTERERYQMSGKNLTDEVELSGLGQLIDAVVTSDRLITFGS